MLTKLNINSFCKVLHRYNSSTVTSALVKELREKSGAGMMDCKKALADKTVNGDIAKAMDWLRSKGIARATSQASRAASEGVIALYSTNNNQHITIAEVNSETDFVSRNKDFHTFIQTALSMIHTANIANTNNDEVAKKVDDLRIQAVGTIKENIVLRRITTITGNATENTLLGSYVHNKLCEDLTSSSNNSVLQIGSQGAIVKLLGSKAFTTEQQEELNSMNKKLCMHIIATNPLYISSKDAPAELIQRERAIFEELTLEQNKNKPKEMLDKIVHGKLNKRLQELSILGNNHMVEPNNPNIEKFLGSISSKMNNTVAIKEFMKWSLGNGNATSV